MRPENMGGRHRRRNDHTTLLLAAVPASQYQTHETWKDQSEGQQPQAQEGNI